MSKQCNRRVAHDPLVYMLKDISKGVTNLLVKNVNFTNGHYLFTGVPITALKSWAELINERVEAAQESADELIAMYDTRDKAIDAALLLIERDGSTTDINTLFKILTKAVEEE